VLKIRKLSPVIITQKQEVAVKWSVFGFCIWVVAGVLFIFKAISAAVPTIDIHIFTIEELAGLEWTQSIEWPRIQEWAVVIAQTNLSILLLGFGLVFIVIGMFMKD